MNSPVQTTLDLRNKPQPQIAGPKASALFSKGRLMRTIGLIIFIGFTGNIIYVASQGEWTVADLLQSVRAEYFLLALVMVLVPLFTHATRIMLWSRVFRCPVSFPDAFTAVMCNEIGSAMTPTAVGGGYAKLYYLYRSGFTPAQATLTMLLGSIEDLAFVATMVGTALYISAGDNNPALAQAITSVLDQAPYLLLLIAVIGGGYVVLRRWRSPKKAADSSSEESYENTPKKSIWERVRAFKDDFTGAVGFALRHGRWTLLINTVLSMLGWICRYGSINAIMAGFGFPVEPLLFPLLNWSVFTVNNFVATPGGMGGAEAAFALVMTGFIPTGMLSLVTFVWRFATFYLALLIGAVVITVRGVEVSGGRK